MPREVLSILVDNHSGVLTRVASLFGRRGFNIDSLTVSATDDPAISRITIVVHDDAKVLEQIGKFFRWIPPTACCASCFW